MCRGVPKHEASHFEPLAECLSTSKNSRGDEYGAGVREKIEREYARRCAYKKRAFRSRLFEALPLKSVLAPRKTGKRGMSEWKTESSSYALGSAKDQVLEVLKSLKAPR